VHQSRIKLGTLFLRNFIYEISFLKLPHKMKYYDDEESYASQRVIFDKVITALDSSEKMFTNRQIFYVKINWAWEHVE